MREVERAAAAHLGRPWTSLRFTDLSERAAHPAGIYRGRHFSVFAKLAAAPDGPEQFAAELRGLGLLRQRAGVRTPVPVSGGLVVTETGVLLLLEALPERPAGRRSRDDCRAIGTAIAALHRVHDEQFGLTQFDGFFGPIAQDNRPVRSNRWADFYAERRVAPLLRMAVDSGQLPAELSAGIEGLIRRLPEVCGPEPRPSLLHGDAQQNNFVSTADGAVVIDPCPYFGHPEVDLALLGYFAPVPADVLNAYRDVAPLDDGYESRRELWRIHGYLAVIAVDGASPLNRAFVGRLADAVRLYSR